MSDYLFRENLAKLDRDVYELTQLEAERQARKLILIPSESTTADAAFNVLRDYIDRFQQGTWPEPNLVIQNTPSPAETDMEFSCEN